MNAVILCSDRCGSASFIGACEHVEDHPGGHGTRMRQPIGYSENHIEADDCLPYRS